MEVPFELITFFFVIFFIIFFLFPKLFKFIYIIPEYQKAVTVQRKKTIDSAPQLHGPGLLFINPFSTYIYTIDIREIEKTSEFHAISKPDNKKLLIQIQWAYRVIDPIKSISIPSVNVAIEGIVIVSLQEIVREMSMESIKNEQIQIEEKWRDRINSGVGNKLGIKFTYGEIKKISRVSLELE
ncbi:MAG: hypothetical protein HN392_09990 [Anaerolineae bacterium]|jgi:regulator of protease activity HflC (stomatin/prohibitin superfamily)|nr:hypothetical protein [Anaerolineae bacterium]MBT7075815.1 hypothetical protein [Anaerolineae bacterium]